MPNDMDELVELELVFGYYEPSDKRKWSAEIRSDEAILAKVRP